MAIQKRGKKPSPIVRARPQQKRGELRVDLILDAVEKILIEEGISGLTLTAVASRSGSAVGSMYRFFSNREQIIEAVVTRLLTSIDEDWAYQMRSQPDTIDTAAFVRWYSESFRVLVERHPVFPAVVRHLSEHCHPLEQLAMKPFDAYLSLHAPAMPKTKKAVACRLMLAMATESLLMCGKLRAKPQKYVWAGLRNALSLLLEGYRSKDESFRALKSHLAGSEYPIRKPASSKGCT